MTDPVAGRQPPVEPPRAESIAAAVAADGTRAPDAGRGAGDVLEIIFDSVPALIWFKDRENRVLRVNRPAAESLGLPAAAIEGRSTYELYPEEAEKYYQDDLEVMRSGRPKLGIIEPIAISGGEKRWVRTDKVPYRNPAGEVIGVIVFAVDITDRMRIEEALRLTQESLERRVAERTAELGDVVADLRNEIAERRRAEERLHEQQAQLAHLQRLRTVESMAAELAHEINQPLAAIVNFASGIVRRLEGDLIDRGTLLEAGEEIRRQAQRAADVVRRLRGFVRKVERPRAPCSLPAVISEASQLVEADLRRLGVALRVESGRGVLLVTVDRTQIEQVAVNLLANALEALADCPGAERLIVVAIECHVDSGFAEVRVRDNGGGLPAGDPEVIFEPFFTTKTDGLGMGLPISRSIIAAHGGTMWAEPAPGGGAVVAFTLPLAPPATRVTP